MSTLNHGGLEAKLEKLGLGPIPIFSESCVLRNPLDIARVYLADILHSLVACGPATAYDSIHWPNDIFTADLTIPLPKLSRSIAPTSLAIELTRKFPNCPLFILPLREGVHLRIMFMTKTLSRLLLPYINDRKMLFGKNLSIALRDPSSPASGCQRLVIEFSSPNITGEFHSKHLRSTVLGAYIANLYKNMGWDVVKINYLGDWGKHIGLLGAGWGMFGSDEQFQTDPVGHMLSVYDQIGQLFQPELLASRAARDSGEDTAAIENHGLFAERNAFFRKMEDGDEKTLTLWQNFRDASIKYYVELYASMNVSFDEYSGESQVSTKSMDEVEEILKNKGICEESEGAWIVDLKKHGGKSGRVIIRDRNGSRTYSLRELAGILDRYRKYSFDKMIYIVADDHDLHFSRVVKILELMGMSDLSRKLQHVHFSKGSEKQSELWSTRTLRGILAECKEATHRSLSDNSKNSALFGDMEESAAAIGVSAIQVQELMAKRSSDHTFDLGQITSFERGTGVDLQYWYARLCSILNSTLYDISNLSDEDFDSFEEEKYTELLRILIQYPEVTSYAYKILEPSAVMIYTLSITDQLKVCLDAEDGQDEIFPTSAETALFEITRQVLQNSMTLLGVRPIIVKPLDGLQ